jgi:hypothetical protein
VAGTGHRVNLCQARSVPGIQLTLLVGDAMDATMKLAPILVALLLPATAWAQRTPLSNKGQPVTAAPSISNPTGTTAAPARPRQRIRKPANGTCPVGWSSSGSYCIKQ